ncbi:LysR family transcriptional regulator [Roseovarius aestuarii]|nr:LysR family transcriptional regulator [Roseovarius aestuarii]
MPEMTLRQIEVIRAVMLRGTINGAAEHLGVSAPGISRLIKHAEESLGIRLFDRRGGLFVPAPEAKLVFDQLHQVYEGVENLQDALGALQKGEDVRLAFASAPSIAQFVAARAIRSIRRRYPDLFIDLNTLKIEETANYLLMERGEFVIMYSPISNASTEVVELARGRVLAVLPLGHRLADRQEISVSELEGEPLIGVDPKDPYGAILAQPFREAGIEPVHSVRGRFAHTVVSLVRQGLGVALVDEFTVAQADMPGLVRVPLAEKVEVSIYMVSKKGRVLSNFAEHAIMHIRKELADAGSHWGPDAVLN